MCAFHLSWHTHSLACQLHLFKMMSNISHLLSFSSHIKIHEPSSLVAAVSENDRQRVWWERLLLFDAWQVIAPYSYHYSLSVHTDLYILPLLAAYFAFSGLMALACLCLLLSLSLSFALALFLLSAFHYTGFFLVSAREWRDHFLQLLFTLNTIASEIFAEKQPHLLICHFAFHLSSQMSKTIVTRRVCSLHILMRCGVFFMLYSLCLVYRGIVDIFMRYQDVVTVIEDDVFRLPDVIWFIVMFDSSFY